MLLVFCKCGFVWGFGWGCIALALLVLYLSSFMELAFFSASLILMDML
jgi:hypothetical protein